MPTERKKIAESSAPENRWRLFEPVAGVKEIFADGAGPMLLGMSNSKLFFFQVKDLVEEAGAAVEEREATVRITIPTRSLVQFCQLVLGGLSENVQGLEEGLEKEKRQLISTLKGIKKD